MSVAQTTVVKLCKSQTTRPPAVIWTTINMFIAMSLDYVTFFSPQNMYCVYWILVRLSVNKCSTFQSHKTQGFCVADFATLSDERRSRSKIFPLFIWIKEPCVRKFEGLERSKRLRISQTIFYFRLLKLLDILSVVFQTRSPLSKHDINVSFVLFVFSASN